MTDIVAGIKVPDSTLCKQATDLVKETNNELLFHHSRRTFFFGALTGTQKKAKFDLELLYVGAMFHDLGLTSKYRSRDTRFEVDGANAASSFLREHKIKDEDIEMVWTAIALHTTPGIPQYMKPVIALVTAGVEMDVLGMGFENVPDALRMEVTAAHPRGDNFKQAIMRTFYDWIKDRPETTFGNVKADVLTHFDPSFKPINFCETILSSSWPS